MENRNIMNEVKDEVYDILIDWGVSVYTTETVKRTHRDFAVVLNPTRGRSVDEKVIFGPNPVTITITPKYLNFCVERIYENIYSGFIRDIVRAINHYAEKHLVEIDHIPAQKFISRIIDSLETLLREYGIPVDHFHFTQLEYFRIVKRFGGRRSWEMILNTVIAQNMEDMPQCYTCKYCVTHNDGYRECKKVYVPIEEDETETQTILRLNKDIPISNAIDDIRKTFIFKDSRCECYRKRETKILDWILD